MSYKVILKNLKNEAEQITLSHCTSLEFAEQAHLNWRKALGNKWTIERRPGVDTIADILALKVEKVK